MKSIHSFSVQEGHATTTNRSYNWPDTRARPPKSHFAENTALLSHRKCLQQRQAAPYALMPSLTSLVKRFWCLCSGFKQAISSTIATANTSCAGEASNVSLQKHSMGM